MFDMPQVKFLMSNNSVKKSIIIPVIFLFLLEICSAQISDIPTSANQLPSPTSIKSPSPEIFFSSRESVLSFSLLVFTFLCLAGEVVLITRSKIFSGEEIIKFFVVTLIIFGTLFLITAGYTNDQIAPAYGVLGTIAGYMLGRNGSEKKNSE